MVAIEKACSQKAAAQQQELWAFLRVVTRQSHRTCGECQKRGDGFKNGVQLRVALPRGAAQSGPAEKQNQGKERIHKSSPPGPVFSGKAGRPIRGLFTGLTVNVPLGEYLAQRRTPIQRT